MLPGEEPGSSDEELEKALEKFKRKKGSQDPPE
jgi:hypothetical protein